ncbi:MAG: hypothetical protein JST31_01725 [Actinobacteria bacterium]|nr:hypothetical protein [Actinomycetota bacterium]
MASIIASEATATRCLLVVAKPAGAPELRRLREIAPGRRLELRVLAPAFVRSRLQFLTSDVDEGIRRARGRLERSLAEIEADGELRARGEVGDADPLLAIDCALATFAADEIVIVRSGERRNWGERRLAAQVGERFSVPVREIEPAL